MSDYIPTGVLISHLETDLIPLALAIVTLEKALVERDAVLAVHKSVESKDSN